MTSSRIPGSGRVAPQTPVCARAKSYRCREMPRRLAISAFVPPVPEMRSCRNKAPGWIGAYAGCANTSPPSTQLAAFIAGLRDHRPSRRSRYSSLPLPLPLLSQPKADTSRLIVVDEQNSSIFERCLNSHYCRNVTRYRPITLLNGNRGGPDPRGL
jgi:hypothetical protein